MAVTKRKRVSKKLKSSWRKHVDISDVESFLDEKRHEEYLGKPLSSFTNEELFQVETDISAVKPLSIKEKRLLKLQTPPKCFSMLLPHTKVSDPIVKRNRVKTKEERKSTFRKKKEALNKHYGIRKAKEIQSEKDRALHKERIKNKPKRGEFNFDIWNVEVFDKVFKGDSSEWINKNTKLHSLHGVGTVPKKMSTTLKQKQTFVSAIEPPHPGMSYNPTFGDHQALLKDIADKESKIIKEEEHLNRVTKGMFKKINDSEKNATWISEMSEGLIKEAEVSGSESDGEFKSVNPPVRNVKKTLKQRRKQKEQMILHNSIRTGKIEKKKIADIHKLKFLTKAIQKKEEVMNKLREKREKKKSDKEKLTKRLSSVKYEEPDLEFNRAEELSGNLRNIKQKGNLLSDRLRSLQKRSLVEPSVIHRQKRSKVKKYVKPGHKDDWKITVARQFVVSNK